MLLLKFVLMIHGSKVQDMHFSLQHKVSAVQEYPYKGLMFRL